MFDRDLWSEIFFSIKKNKLRTFLTGFSVAWGIFILVMLLASVKGMENGFTKSMMTDATNSIFIRSHKTSKAHNGFEAGRKIQFTNKDISYLKSNFNYGIESITPVVSKYITAKYKKETGLYDVRGVNTDNTAVENLTITKGRSLQENDIINRKKVIIIGKKVEEDLFKNTNPIGKYLLINNSFYKIIGVFTDGGNEWEERVINCPYTTLQQTYKNTQDISFIILTYKKSFTLLEALNFSKQLEHIIKRKHNMSSDDTGISISDNIEDFTDMTKFVTMLQGISLVVGILILLSGIIGIANILVFIIKERTKEIGIRKALGARPIQIINLVILESVFITTVSGMGGVFFAMLIVNSIGPLIDSEAFSNPSVDLNIVLTALTILIFSGILAGLIPAIRASNVKPIVALKDD